MMYDGQSADEDVGFFVPYSQRRESRPSGYRHLAPIFAAARPACQATLSAVETLRDDLRLIDDGKARPTGARPPRFGQEWFPRLDAAVAYALVRRESPRRVIEIGSGHSTRFLCQAVVDGGLATDIICIDPHPRAPLAGLPVRHIEKAFGPEHADLAGELRSGDIVFVDSSHVAMPGTDVDRLLLDVLPLLPVGALIHFHDIFLPDGYPAAWAKRSYNEQIAVGALLQGGAYGIVFASHYVKTQTDMLARSCISSLTEPATCMESSLWLRKAAPVI